MIQKIQEKLPDWNFKYNSLQSPRAWIFCYPPTSEEKPLEVLQAIFERVEISIVGERVFAFPLGNVILNEKL